MKKRNYLSPHTWQQSQLSDLETPPKGYSKFLMKGPIKIGRYLAVLLLAGIVFALTFHHSKNTSSPLAVAEIGPTIQTISLPTLAHPPSNSSKAG